MIDHDQALKKPSAPAFTSYAGALANPINTSMQMLKRLTSAAPDQQTTLKPMKRNSYYILILSFFLVFFTDAQAQRGSRTPYSPAATSPAPSHREPDPTPVSTPDPAPSYPSYDEPEPYEAPEPTYTEPDTYDYDDDDDDDNDSWSSGSSYDDDDDDDTDYSSDYDYYEPTPALETIPEGIPELDLPDALPPTDPAITERPHTPETQITELHGPGKLPPELEIEVPVAIETPEPPETPTTPDTTSTIGNGSTNVITNDEPECPQPVILPEVFNVCPILGEDNCKDLYPPHNKKDLITKGLERLAWYTKHPNWGDLLFEAKYQTELLSVKCMIDDMKSGYYRRLMPTYYKEWQVYHTTFATNARWAMKDVSVMYAKAKMLHWRSAMLRQLMIDLRDHPERKHKIIKWHTSSKYHGQVYLKRMQDFDPKFLREQIAELKSQSEIWNHYHHVIYLENCMNKFHRSEWVVAMNERADKLLAKNYNGLGKRKAARKLLQAYHMNEAFLMMEPAGMQQMDYRLKLKGKIKELDPDLSLAP